MVLQDNHRNSGNCSPHPVVTTAKFIGCCFAPPSGRNLQGYFSHFLVNFSRCFPRSQSVLVNFSRRSPRFQSALVKFSQFQSVLLKQWHLPPRGLPPSAHPLLLAHNTHGAEVQCLTGGQPEQNVYLYRLFILLNFLLERHKISKEMPVRAETCRREDWGGGGAVQTCFCGRGGPVHILLQRSFSLVLDCLKYPQQETGQRNLVLRASPLSEKKNLMSVIFPPPQFWGIQFYGRLAFLGAFSAGEPPQCPYNSSFLGG